jgi:1-acyl-sn-glycerol-3-phosphate acyltransferase
MLYKSIRALLRFIFYFLGLKVEGLENIPRTGPVIIAANHVSNWDPVVVALVVKRPIHFMAKVSLFKFKLTEKLFITLHAFPVKRGVADRQAIRQALLVLEEGNVLGIFPEGARNKTGDLKALAGVGMIALKSGAPVVPVACLGTRHILPLGWLDPLVVRIGKPVYSEEIPAPVAKSSRMEQYSGEIMNKIKILLNK